MSIYIYIYIFAERMLTPIAGPKLWDEKEGGFQPGWSPRLKQIKNILVFPIYSPNK